MTDTLALFADQVTNVAREVGVEEDWEDRHLFRVHRVSGKTLQRM
jgi:hypothetical protein